MARQVNGNALTDRLGALSDPTRLRMLRLLEMQELSVGEVASVFQLHLFASKILQFEVVDRFAHQRLYGLGQKSRSEQQAGQETRY